MCDRKVIPIQDYIEDNDLNEKSYCLTIDYDVYKPKTYRGIVIYESDNESFKEIIRVNTGNAKLDEDEALNRLYDIAGEVDVSYLSKYEDYHMDVKLTWWGMIKFRVEVWLDKTFGILK